MGRDLKRRARKRTYDAEKHGARAEPREGLIVLCDHHVTWRGASYMCTLTSTPSRLFQEP